MEMEAAVGFVALQTGSATAAQMAELGKGPDYRLVHVEQTSLIVLIDFSTPEGTIDVDPKFSTEVQQAATGRRLAVSFSSTEYAGSGVDKISG